MRGAGLRRACKVCLGDVKFRRKVYLRCVPSTCLSFLVSPGARQSICVPSTYIHPLRYLTYGCILYSILPLGDHYAEKLGSQYITTFIILCLIPLFTILLAKIPLTRELINGALGGGFLRFHGVNMHRIASGRALVGGAVIVGGDLAINHIQHLENMRQIVNINDELHRMGQPPLTPEQVVDLARKPGMHRDAAKYIAENTDKFGGAARTAAEGVERGVKDGVSSGIREGVKTVTSAIRDLIGKNSK